MKNTPVLIALSSFLLTSPVVSQDQPNRMNSATFDGLELRNIGPAMMAGRISDIAIHPDDQSTWYVAVGSGGVWKTMNSGTTWDPIFDEQASYSIGCVTLDPNNPEIVWVGTGENVSGRHVGYGDGVYKSLDGGRTWTNMGLRATEHISRIVVDPRNSDAVYVASEGPLWAPGGERGLYKTQDGGATWDHSLSISENTGVVDVEIDPRNPDVVYAAAYQRRRSVWALLAGGEESGIFKSTDAGESWREVTNGLPRGDMGKIDISVSPIDPDVVYATVEANREERGFYRSGNSGESWEKRNSFISGGTGPHYYQEIFASPHKIDRVYQMAPYTNITDDGGWTFAELGEEYAHGDNHALAFDLDDPDYLLMGSDGGLFETWDHGKNWKFIANLPVTQFYKLALDNDYPFYNVGGGTQDNNTQIGPSRTTNLNGIRNSDWYNTIAGDGYALQIDPEDPNIIYTEWQNGGLMRFDRRNGELLDIKPQPAPGDPPERWNWDAPILISPHSHTRLYYGSQRLWRSDDRGDSWTALSEDLSRDLNRYELEMMDRVWSVDDLYDNGSMSRYSNLTTISESPLVEGLIYVGTDDGLIQVTEDGGGTWRRVETFPGVPEFAFVNEIKASVHDPNTVFAALDHHKQGDFAPYLIESNDRGRSWHSMSGDLPERHLVWSIVQDHQSHDLFFAGTEFGIFFSIDRGEHWIELNGGAPTIAFRDLEIQRRETDLVGASFGRGFFIFDDYSALRHVDADVLNGEAALFPIRDALLYVPSIPLGLRENSNQGNAAYMAPNPPFGAIITYYLGEALQTAKDRRHQSERDLREARANVPFPGFETIEEENREDEPTVVFTIRDEDGEVVRRITGSARKGFHRVAWDLRFPPHTPTEVDSAPIGSLWANTPAGPMVVPGTYSVSMAKLVNGSLVEMSSPQQFEVTALDNSSLPIADREEVLAFQREVGDLYRQALSAAAAARDVAERLPFIKRAILETPSAPPALLERTRDIELRLADIQKLLSGNQTRARYWEFTVPSVLGRIADVVGGRRNWATTYGPTATHRQSFEVAMEQFEEVRMLLRVLIESDLSQLEAEMEAAGVPWTPGRMVPGTSF